MILNESICTEIGDVIFMQSVTMLGIKKIYAINDNVTGENDIRFFERKMAYSLDMGVTWSDLFKLDEQVLATIEAKPNFSTGNTSIARKADGNVLWGRQGAFIMENDFTPDGNGTVHAHITTPHYWLNGTAIGVNQTSGDGKINNIAVWVQGAGEDPFNTPVGFVRTIDAPSTKIYYVGLAGDNVFSLKINGIQIFENVQFIATVPGQLNFQALNIYPITLNGGSNTLEFSAINVPGPDPNPGLLAVEIYDNTANEIANSTQDSDLNILFSTRDIIGQAFDLSENAAYVCPDGWFLSLDNGIYTCNKSGRYNTVELDKLNQLLLTNEHELVLDFFYKRIGIDNTGELQLNGIFVDGNYVERSTNFVISKKSMFSDLVYNNIEVMNLVTNLSQKMFERGIVPAYVERKEVDVDILNDEDYIDFWQIVSTFYAVLFIDSIKFENIYWRRNILCEFLRQRGVFFCNCEDIIELQQIAQNFYDEIRVRGTREIFNPKGYQYSMGHRYAYVIGDYEIMPSFPVKIDGVVYREAYTMPFGWVVQDSLLVSPDTNYHKVEIVQSVNEEDGSFNYLTILSKVMQLATNESGVLKSFNGEYLRLICYNACDEFIPNNVPTKFVGWCVDHSSPLYRGLRPQRNKDLIKAYEVSYNVLDLNKYPVTNENNVFVGLTKNPYGVDDTVIYMSKTGALCFGDVVKQVFNVITHFHIYLNFDQINKVKGLITMVDRGNGEVTQVPVELVGNMPGMQLIEVYSGIRPSTYDVNINLIFFNRVSGYARVGAVNFDISAINNSINETYVFNQVKDTLLEISLNFSV